MRCKNCGCENDDNLYICQNCGSPLYDENEPVNDGGTQVFPLAGANGTMQPDDEDNKAAAALAEEEERKEKQQKTVITVLAVVLALIIIGTVIAVVAGRKNATPETTGDTSVSETVSETETQKESTTASTTESTTASTTESTTASTTAAETLYTVSVSGNEGGGYNGGGSFKLGENVTVKATADSGYEFDGWYEGNNRVSTNATYTFTVTKDVQLKAVFRIVDVETSTEGTDEQYIDGDDFN